MLRLLGEQHTAMECVAGPFAIGCDIAICVRSCNSDENARRKSEKVRIAIAAIHFLNLCYSEKPTGCMAALLGMASIVGIRRSPDSVVSIRSAQLRYLKRNQPDLKGN
jgi:hypothetical protein